MKILYAIQGTGNGHISRARDIIPILARRGELDLLISGSEADLTPDVPVRYQFKGLSFVFGKKGGIDLWKTYFRANFANLLKEIDRLPITEYDLVINDFEPVSAWACFRKNMPCVSLSHQAALLNKHVPKPGRKGLVGKFVLRNYAPTNYQFGFHFQAYADRIFTPVIRQEVRQAEIQERDHFTVYLPAYDDVKLIHRLQHFHKVRWELFSKHRTEEFIFKNIRVRPISNDAFITSMAHSRGVLCGAGFETPAEALFLGKKLMVIPMKGQYEQHCNAAALRQMGVPVLKKFSARYSDRIHEWIKSGEMVHVDYPNLTEQIIDTLLAQFEAGLFRARRWKHDFASLAFPD